MSAYYEIYARERKTGADFLGDVSSILDAEANDHADGNGYLIETPTAFVDIYLAMDLTDDDPDIPFSSLPLCVTVRDRDSDKDRAEVLARRIYGDLVDSCRYDCYLVYDLQILVANSVGA